MYRYLRQLRDVLARSPQDGDTLVYDAVTGKWTAGAGGSGSLSSAAFGLTAQQIKDSTLTPHTIIPAQGAGKLIVPTMFVFNSTPGGTPFNDSAVELVYGDLNLNTLAVILTQRYVGYVFHALSSGWTEGGDPANYLNQPVRIRASLRGAIMALGSNSDDGTGYAVGDTGTVDFGSTDATYIVTAISVGGAASGVAITSGGDGYNLNAGGAVSTWTTTPGGAQPGAGSGLQVQVSEVDASASAGDGTLSGVVYYEVADLA